MGFQIIESTFDLQRTKENLIIVKFNHENEIHLVNNELQSKTGNSKEEIIQIYNEILNLSIQNQIQSIVIPLMPYTNFHSADLFMLVFNVINTFLSEYELDIYLYIESYYRVKRNKEIENVLYQDINAFIKDIPEYHHRTTIPSDHPREASNLRNFVHPSISPSYMHDFSFEDEMNEMLKESKDITFGDRLLQIIDEKGYAKYSTVYNKAIVDRRLFHNIISKKDYLPKKNTVILLALALELNEEEAKDFLSYAGYAFSNTRKDQIILCCIQNHYFNIMYINAYLYDKGLLPILNIE